MNRQARISDTSSSYQCSWHNATQKKSSGVLSKEGEGQRTGLPCRSTFPEIPRSGTHVLVDTNEGEHQLVAEQRVVVGSQSEALRRVAVRTGRPSYRVDLRPRRNFVDTPHTYPPEINPRSSRT